MRRLYVLGDSHATALVQASRQWHFFQGSDEPFVPYMVDCGLICHELLIEYGNGTSRLNPIFEMALERVYLLNRFTGAYAAHQGDLGLLFGFVDVHMLGFVSSLFEGYPIDGSAHGSLEDNDEVLFALLTEFFRQRFANYDKAIGFLQTVGFSVFLLPGPPPSCDEAIAKGQDVSFRPAPQMLRVAIYRAMKRALSELAHRRGVKFIDRQETFEDADGLLKREYDGDGVHANMTYALDFIPLIFKELGREVNFMHRGGA